MGTLLSSNSSSGIPKFSFRPFRMFLADTDTITFTSSRQSSAQVWKPRHEISLEENEQRGSTNPATAIRNLRIQTAKTRSRIESCKQQSRLLRNYGKALFDEALSHTGSTFRSPPKKITLDCIRPHTTGPTLYGSLLYNPHAKVLNQIRTKSSSPEKYLSRYPRSNTFQRYNYRFSVVTTGEKESSPVNRLVPLLDDDLSGDQSEEELADLW